LLPVHPPLPADANLLLTTVEAEEQLVNPLFEFRNYGQQMPHNWSTISNGAALGTDYFYCGVGIALFFDFVNGFHDSANSVATVIGT
jgi:hypothetical protein